MRKLTDHLFFIQDTCSVYGVTANDKTLLIDCGTSPTKLETNGVQQVDQVLLTHFHRDTCSAASHWNRGGAQIVLPFAEKRFFEETDLLKASYDIYDNYTSYYPCFGPLEDLAPDQYAYDYESLSWEGIRFDVIPLPGHTFGSVGYLFELDGQADTRLWGPDVGCWENSGLFLESVELYGLSGAYQSSGESEDRCGA